MIHKQKHSKEGKKKRRWIQSILYLQFYRHLISFKGIIGTQKEIRKETDAQINNITYCKLNLKEKGEKIKTMDQHFNN